MTTFGIRDQVMNFTEQAALAIAKKAYPNDPDVWHDMIDGMMTIYHLGVEQGKSTEVKRAFWDGVKAGVERYSYHYQPSGYKNPSYRAVGPDGTTHLDSALYYIEQEAQAALKSK